MLVFLGRCCRRGEAQAGEAYAEERAAPLVQEEKCSVSALVVDGVDELGCCVPRACEGCRQLHVHWLDPRGRREAVGPLACRVQLVLQPAKQLERLLVLELRWVCRELFELEQRPCKSAPERTDLCRVSLPNTPDRSHG